MKTAHPLSLSLAGILAVGGATLCRAADNGSFWSRKLDLVVVAEQPRPEKKFVAPTADRPAYYATYDGGYIEAGDPYANERPPAAADVAHALVRSLAPQHYLPATNQAPPTVLLIYHWGVLNRSTTEIGSGLELGPNLRARIALVAPDRYARMIEQDLLDERTTREAMYSRVWIPSFLNFRERDILELSRDERYFVIVSAYDYAALGRHKAKLLWRVKTSTRNAGVAMDTALPALLRSGAPFFGQNLDEPQYVHTSEVPEGRVEVGEPKVEEYLPPPAVARELADPFLHHLADREHRKFSGVRRSDAGEDRAASPPAVPPPADRPPDS